MSFLDTRRFKSTGVLSGAGITINADPSKFDIQVVGEVVDTTTNIVTKVMVNQTGVSVTNIATQNETYVLVDSSGTVVQQSTPPTIEQLASHLSYWVVVHSNRTSINVINDLSLHASNLALQFNQLQLFFGFMNYEGNVFSPGTTGVRVSKDSGMVFKPGVSMDNNVNNFVSLSSITDISNLRHRLRGGSEGADTLSIDTSNYDNADVLTAIPNNKYVVHRIYLFSSNLVRIQYGQSVYDNLDEAELSISNEHYLVESNMAQNGLLRAYLVVREGTADWTNPAHFKFIEASRFGNLPANGGIVNTFQSTYGASAQPQIVTNSTRGALDLQSGTGNNADNIMRWKNNSGTVTAHMDGNGNLWVSSNATDVQTQINNNTRPTAMWYSDSSNVDPVDGSVYCNGAINNIAFTNDTTFQITCTKNNAKFYISWTDYVTGILGSTEGSTIRIHNVTQATSEILTTVHTMDKKVSASHMISTLAFNDGDLFYIEKTHPTWATNPTVVYQSVMIYQY